MVGLQIEMSDYRGFTVCYASPVGFATDMYYNYTQGGYCKIHALDLVSHGPDCYYASFVSDVIVTKKGGK